MSKMWEKIRYGVRWRPSERAALACRSLDLKTVKSLNISFDPFCPESQSLRMFWFYVTSPGPTRTNPSLKVTYEIRNDRKPPFFFAQLHDGKKLLFETEGMHLMDMLMTFNRLLGNPVLGKSGVKPLPKLD